jgi:hypothetical protein
MAKSVIIAILSRNPARVGLVRQLNSLARSALAALLRPCHANAAAQLAALAVAMPFALGSVLPAGMATVRGSRRGPKQRRESSGYNGEAAHGVPLDRAW